MSSRLYRCGNGREDCGCGCGPESAAESTREPGLEGLGNQWLARTLVRHPAPRRESLGSVGALALAGASGRPVLARSLLDDAIDFVGDVLNVRENEADKDCAEDLDAFRKKTFATLKNHKPSTGLGMFDVDLDPKAGRLSITLKLKFDFKDGDPSKASKGFRPEEFKWTDEQKKQYKARFTSEVGGAWGGKHVMKSTKPGCWSKVTIATNVVVTESDPGHFNATVTKYPDDARMITSSVCPPGFQHDGSGNCSAHAGGHGTGEFDSNDLRREQKLGDSTGSGQVQFREGSATLDAAGRSVLKPLIDKMKAAPTSTAALTGRANTKHKHGVTADQGAIDNMDLARGRTAAVKAEIEAAGIASDRILVRNVGEDGASDGAEWCRVDVKLSSKPTQTPGVHEVGHMLGLGDEYPTSAQPKGGKLGNLKYRQMVKDINGSDLIVDRNEGIMSSGDKVQKHNYGTFLEALKKITGEDTWSL